VVLRGRSASWGETVLVRAILAVAVLGAATGDPKFWDPVVSGVTLADVRTGKAFIMRHGPVGEEPEDDFPQFRCLNADGTEILALILHYGSERYAFGQFRVWRPTPAEATQGKRAAVPSFVTSKGLRLGLTIEEVVASLGPGQRSDHPGEVRLRYFCDSVKACPGLQRVNMPQYEAAYTFRHGRLVSIEGGYPYP
jgi:hypothetical protein